MGYYYFLHFIPSCRLNKFPKVTKANKWEPTSGRAFWSRFVFNHNFIDSSTQSNGKKKIWQSTKNSKEAKQSLKWQQHNHYVRTEFPPNLNITVIL